MSNTSNQKISDKKSHRKSNGSSSSTTTTTTTRRRRSQFRPWNSYLAKKETASAISTASKRSGEVAVVRKLTVGLIGTYEGINEIYYKRLEENGGEKGLEKGRLGDRETGGNRKGDGASKVLGDRKRSERKGRMGKVGSKGKMGGVMVKKYCDENYDYIVKKGELFNMRYVLERVVGKGSFGQVVRAYDTKMKEHVAIKIIKNSKPYFEQALSEVRMTAYLNRIDPDDAHAIMRLRDKFIFRGHQCLVLELLSFSLYDLLRSTEFYGVSLNLVRKFCRQIASCLAFLALPEVNIIHCDLKPENVLLRHPQRSIIKVVDFGSSCRVSEVLYTYVQSRFYRAPEVLLGFPYSTQIDVWSLGCMMVELHTGYPLFAGVDEVDQMHAIVERLGLPPNSMLDGGTKTSCFFEYDTPSGEYTMIPSSNPQRDPTTAPGSKSISNFIEEYTGALAGKRKRESAGHGQNYYELFTQLALRMLDYNPATRITAEEVLQHPYITGIIPGGLNRSGRESPPPIPANAKIGDSVHLSLDPGRKAPVQRSSIPSETPDAGGRLRLSRSETSMITAGSLATSAASGLCSSGGLLTLNRHWAEEVGIEPPAWRQKSAPNPFSPSNPHGQVLFPAGRGARLSRSRPNLSRPQLPSRRGGRFSSTNNLVPPTLTRNVMVGRPKSMSSLENTKTFSIPESSATESKVGLDRDARQIRGRGHGVAVT